jgi:ABC-type sugar transport system ATPase subunit
VEGPSGGKAVALRLRGISKTYPGVEALTDIDLDIAAGEVHGLVGENGAGKSTLLKVIAGADPPSAGTIELFGEPVELSDPHTARVLGIRAVYQELMVIPALSAVANVFLGQAKRIGPVQDRKAERTRFLELCRTLDVEINPNARADSLPIANQQMLEIMRGIEQRARILVLDEPTASLALHEREALYKTIRSLRSHGETILLISHDLEEVLQLSDTITVLRDGQKVGTSAAREWSKRSLIHAMLGEDLALRGSHRRRPGAEVLRAENVRVPGFLLGIDLSVRAGEIVGIAGLVGAGRTELLRALAGLDPASEGSLRIDGKAVPWPRSPHAALELGIALAPEDRKSQGLVLGMPTFDNLNLASLGRVSTGSVLVRSRELARAEALGSRVKLQSGAIRRTTRLLSGGNQQKVVLAKWTDRDVRVLLVDEPTRGIDVGAKAEVFGLLDDLASKGTGVVMVSSEFEELVENCDRVVAIGTGRILGEFEGASLTQSSIMATLFEVS